MVPDSDPAADIALVKRVLAGDGEARSEFVDRMRIVGRVLSARNARMGRPFGEQDLEDLAQDALVVVWRKLDVFAGEASLESWVFRICAYELLNAIRRKQKRSRSVELTPAIEENVRDTSEEPEPVDDRRLDRFVRHLAAREGEVLRLHHVDGLTLQEIGEVLGVSVSSVKTHYYRGLDKLRKVMPTEGDG